MNDQRQLMGQSQILQSYQNYVAWPHLPPFYPPENLARPQAFHNHHPGRVNWKREKRRRIGPGLAQGFCTPSDSQVRYGGKGRRFHHPKMRHHRRLTAPFAPRNTTSFIIRAKRSGGIAALVSPSPWTPSILPTPKKEVLEDIAKDELDIDDYGTMKDRIRLRRDSDEESEVMSGGSEGMESEKELDYDLSRFEMISPEDRVHEKAQHIAHLTEENLALNERIFLVEGELADMRRRVLQMELETGGCCSEPEIINDRDGGRS